MFDFLAELLSYIMWFCDKISFHNYALSLFLFALIIKILLFPLSIKTQKNQVKSAKLRPKEMAIRKKYSGRNDQATQQKMAMELQDMYKAEGHNQFGGCLPMLIQFPVLFALYEIIRNPLYYVCDFGKAQIEVVTDAFQKIVGYQSASSLPALKAAAYVAESPDNIQNIIDHLPVDGTVPAGADFATYAEFRADLINKLLTTDNYPQFNLFGFIDLSVSPNEQIWWYVLIPVAVFLVYFFTMKIQKKFMYQAPTAGDAQMNMSMKMMDYSMPAVSAVFAFSVPTGLGFYWMYQSVIGLLQQIILSKMYPLPKYTDEELKQMERDMEREAKEQRKAEAAERKKLKTEREFEEDDVPRRKPMTVEEEDAMLKRFKASSDAAENTNKKKKNK